MSKKTEKQTPAFVAGDRVTVIASGLTGTVDLITAQGWVVVHLDNPPEDKTVKDGRVSLRAKALKAGASPAPAKPGSFAAQVDAVVQAAGNKAVDQAAADHVARMAPSDYTQCPKCGSKEIFTGRNVDGIVRDEDKIVGCHECDWLIDHTTPASQMSEALRKARVHYKKDKRPDGSGTAHCNDQVAKALRDLEPVEVAYLADRVLQVPEGFHVQKYASLNAGQVRMNSGNRIRAAWKHANEDGNTDEITRIGKLLMLVDDEEQEEEASE